MADIIYFVIPCYNEEEVLPTTAAFLADKMNSLIKAKLASAGSRILFVDDGSKDKTWAIIEGLCNKSRIFTGVILSCNRGHQNALLAGLMSAMPLADAVISMDADMQDDINVVDQFLQKYYDGCEIVYGVRSSRTTDTFFKRTTAVGFYKLIGFMGVNVVYNHADYRLMSKRALECLAEFREVNLFLRGIIPLIGLKSAIVTYKRGERAAGKSKYPLRKMLSFAFDGITSFSVKPIRLITTLGASVSIISAIAFIAVLISKLCGYTVAGWPSLLCSIWFLGGVQMLSLGVIGEYVGKVYAEVKSRPRFIIEKSVPGRLSAVAERPAKISE